MAFGHVKPRGLRGETRGEVAFEAKCPPLLKKLRFGIFGVWGLGFRGFRFWVLGS